MTVGLYTIHSSYGTAPTFGFVRDASPEITPRSTFRQRRCTVKWGSMMPDTPDISDERNRHDSRPVSLLSTPSSVEIGLVEPRRPLNITSLN